MNLQSSWKIYFRTLVQNEGGDKNMEAYVMATLCTHSRGERLRVITQSQDTIVWSADQGGKLQILHSLVNFGGK